MKNILRFGILSAAFAFGFILISADTASAQYRGGYADREYREQARRVRERQQRHERDAEPNDEVPRVESECPLQPHEARAAVDGRGVRQHCEEGRDSRDADEREARGGYRDQQHRDAAVLLRAVEQLPDLARETGQ